MIQQIIDQLQNSRSILVVSHTNPDGDAIGALLAAGLAHRDGKNADAIKLLEGLTCQRMGATGDPLVIALRCAMPWRSAQVKPRWRAQT